MLKRSTKFPLIMQSGVKVRTIEELREHFEIETVLELFFDGRLKTWLEQRFYRNELTQLESIKDMTYKEAEEVAEKLYGIFNVSCTPNSLVISHVIKRLEKIELLKQYSKIPCNAGEVAICQEELYQLLEDNKSADEMTLYLLGDNFEISDEYSDMHYIGLNNPKVSLLSNGEFDAMSKNISFTDLTLISHQEVKFKPSKNTNVIIEDERIKEYKNLYEPIVEDILSWTGLEKQIGHEMAFEIKSIALSKFERDFCNAENVDDKQVERELFIIIYEELEKNKLNAGKLLCPVHESESMYHWYVKLRPKVLAKLYQETKEATIRLLENNW